jgi:hypothetical protein
MKLSSTVTLLLFDKITDKNDEYLDIDIVQLTVETKENVFVPILEQKSCVVYHNVFEPQLQDVIAIVEVAIYLSQSSFVVKSNG